MRWFYTYNDKFDPRWTEHVVDEIIFMVAPVIANFADLEALQVIVIVHQCVHVSMQALQIVNACRVKFNLDEILWVCYQTKSECQNTSYELRVLVSEVADLFDETYFQ